MLCWKCGRDGKLIYSEDPYDDFTPYVVCLGCSEEVSKCADCKSVERKNGRVVEDDR